MQRLHLDDREASTRTVAVLQAGDVVVVPTDTVYGLAALAGDEGARQRIYEAKGRPAQLHLPVMAASLDQVGLLGVDFTPAAHALAARWWPGPLTLIFGFAPDQDRPAWLTGRDEVAVRIPNHSFMLSVLRQTGPLLVTSANTHGQDTAPLADEAAQDLAPQVSLVVDGGTLETTPSTLVSLRGAEPVVERVGTISAAEIAETLAEVKK
ncbi:MAG TPA: L-threonylcarbamoyladenylate synthase [Acidimicrobiales bacterium]|jgi:L-threonylcarbamoyladenylate synthase